MNTPSPQSPRGAKLRPLFFDDGRIIVRQQVGGGLVRGSGEFGQHPVVPHVLLTVEPTDLWCTGRIVLKSLSNFILS